MSHKLKKCAVVGTSYFSEKSEINKLASNLKELGLPEYEVFNSNRNFFYRWAGTPKERLELFYKAWNSENNPLFAMRGGSGVSHFIKDIDISKLKKDKIFVGYSDLTLLLNFLRSKRGLISLHGPMALADLDYKSLFYLKKALMMEDYSFGFKKRNVLNQSNRKQIGGELVGGNLTRLVESLLYYDINFNDKILFLEEVGENPTKVLNLFFNLVSSKNFKPQAILLGYLDFEVTPDFLEVAKDIFEDIPIIFNLPFGHHLPNVTIPIGANSMIDFNLSKIQISFPNEEKNYAIKFENSSYTAPELFRESFVDFNRRNRLHIIPKNEESVKRILKKYRGKNLLGSVKFVFPKNVFPISVSGRIRFNESSYFFVGLEEGVSRIFIQRGRSLKPLEKIYPLREPQVSFNNGEYNLFGFEGGNFSFYSGQNIFSLEKVFSMPVSFDSISFLENGDGFSGFFSIKNKVKYFHVENLRELNNLTHHNTKDIFEFRESESVKIHQVFFLENGFLGSLISTLTKSKKAGNLFRFPRVFAFDPGENLVSSSRIILKRSELLEGDSRNSFEYNLISPGGLDKRGVDYKMYCIVGNNEFYSVKLKNPFFYYESKF